MGVGSMATMRLLILVLNMNDAAPHPVHHPPPTRPAFYTVRDLGGAGW
jgi:hypothetical protein